MEMKIFTERRSVTAGQMLVPETTLTSSASTRGLGRTKEPGLGKYLPNSESGSTLILYSFSEDLSVGHILRFL